MDLNGDMIRGHIDTIILLSLVDGDKDSNEIRKNIEDRSDNKFSVKQGTFYSAMQRLVKQSLIKEYRSSATDGIRRKYFSLTEKGEKQQIANTVRGLAARGGDFSELAKKYSEDNATKNSGGDLGYNLLYDEGKKSLPAQINAGLNLVKRGYQVGTVSTVRELVGKGFYIIKIISIEKDMDSIRTRVKNYLGEIRMRESFVKWLEDETKRVSVKLYK